MLRLNLGSGPHKKAGFINIDLHGSDLDLDLENASLPYPDESVDVVWASHVMEHIRNFLPLMNEIHRVMKPGAQLYIEVPVLPNIQAFSDPTHVRFFTEHTLLYFVAGDWLHEQAGASYGIKPFSKIDQRTEGIFLMAALIK